jgi:hypothetical protein
LKQYSGVVRGPTRATEVEASRSTWTVRYGNRSDFTTEKGRVCSKRRGDDPKADVFVDR